VLVHSYPYPTQMMRRCMRSSIGQRATGTTSSVLRSSNSTAGTSRPSSALHLRYPIQHSKQPYSVQQCRLFATAATAAAGTTDRAVQAATTARLLEAKRAVGLTFQELADIVSVHEVFLASAMYGQNSLTIDTAQQLLDVLHISDDSELLQALTDYPLKTGLSQSVPTDPLIYRFHEITQIYGVSMKAIIQEKFGDGIMSAIDFTMDIQKQEHVKGDRVIVTLNGKFLPYNKW
jgi:cyanate lyase